MYTRTRTSGGSPPGTWPLTATGLSLIAVCYGLARFAYGLFVPALRTEFALSDTLLGAVAAGSYVGYCVAVLAAAAAVARFGARTTAVAAGVLAAAGMLLVALSWDAWALAAGVLVAGSSTGVASPPLAEAITRVVAHPRRDRAQAIVNAGPGAGIAISGPVALLTPGHWRAAWLLFAVIAVLVIIAVRRTLPPNPSNPPRERQPSSGLVTLVTTRASWHMTAAAALFGMASAAVWIFGQDHVSRASGMGQTGSTLLWVLLGVSELAGVVAGDAIRWQGLRRVWVASVALLAGSTVVIASMPGARPTAFAAVALFGATYVILTTVIFLWATRLHPQHTAAGIAVGFLAIAAGQACASPIIGAIADQFGTGTAFTTCTLLGLSATIFAPRNRYPSRSLTAPGPQHEPQRPRGHCRQHLRSGQRP